MIGRNQTVPHGVYQGFETGQYNKVSQKKLEQTVDGAAIKKLAGPWPGSKMLVGGSSSFQDGHFLKEASHSLKELIN